VVSLVYSQTDILSKEVLLVEGIGTSTTRMKHMNAIVFVRPTLDSIRKLVDELRDPKFNDYYICALLLSVRDV
jgi:vacuolar protein sorting-associated protein 45